LKAILILAVLIRENEIVKYSCKFVLHLTNIINKNQVFIFIILFTMEKETRKETKLANKQILQHWPLKLN